MAGLKKMTLSVCMSEEDVEKAKELKRIMAEYDPDAYADCGIEDVLARVIELNMRRMLKEEMGNYEWLAEFVKSHPEIETEWRERKISTKGASRNVERGEGQEESVGGLSGRGSHHEDRGERGRKTVEFRHRDGHDEDTGRGTQRTL